MRRIYKSLAIGIASLSLLGTPAYAAFDQAALNNAIAQNNSATALTLLTNATGNDANQIAALIGSSTNAAFLTAVLNGLPLGSTLAPTITDAIVAGVGANGKSNSANAAFIAQIANGLTGGSASSALGTSVGQGASSGLITALGNTVINNQSYSISFQLAANPFGGVGGAGGAGGAFGNSLLLALGAGGSGSLNPALSGNTCPSGTTPDSNGSCS
jgi:hypothetical protein